MIKTFNRKKNLGIKSITVNVETLAGILDCGMSTARKIGDASGAKIRIGSRVLYKLDLVNDYLDNLAKESKPCKNNLVLFDNKRGGRT